RLRTLHDTRPESAEHAQPPIAFLTFGEVVCLCPYPFCITTSSCLQETIFRSHYGATMHKRPPRKSANTFQLAELGAIRRRTGRARVTSRKPKPCRLSSADSIPRRSKCPPAATLCRLSLLSSESRPSLHLPAPSMHRSL